MFFQTKLAILEEKLLKEERERLLVQDKADQVGAVFSVDRFSLKCTSNDGLLLHSCRRSWTQTSRRLPKSQRRRKAHRKQSPPEYFFIFSTICILLRWRSLLHKGDISFFSTSEKPSALSGAFTKWAKAQENAFCCRKGKISFPSSLSLKPVGAD